MSLYSEKVLLDKTERLINKILYSKSDLHRG
jgi:hypothetical protein